MRTAVTTRSVPPKLRTNTLHAWCFDQAATGNDAVDLSGYGGNPRDLSESGTPPPIATGGFGAGGSRSFTGTQYMYDSGATGTDVSDASGSISVRVGFALSTSFTTYGALVSYVSDWNDDDDCCIEVGVDANRNVVAKWHYGSSQVYTCTFTAIDLVLGKPYIIHVVRDVSGNACYLFVNGDLVDTVTASWQDPSVVGTDQVWRVGASYDTAAYSDFFKGTISSVFIDHDMMTAAEITEDFRRAMLWDGDSSIHVMVEVQDYNGAWQDMTDLFGTDWLAGLIVSDGSDDATESMQVELTRSVYNASLAKYHDNLMNRPDDWSQIGPQAANAYNEDGSEDLLGLTRGIRMKWARCPLDVAPISSDWRLRFEGYIHTIGWHSDPIKVECRDKGDKLQDAYIRESTTYPTDGDDAVALEDIIDNSDSSSILEHIYAQGWIDEAITLYTPVATPATLVFDHWQQDRDVVMSLLTDLANAIGYCCRYRWNYETGQHELTLYEPDRSKSYGDCFLSADDYLGVNHFSVSKADVRNVIHGVFASTAPGTVPTGVTDYGGWDDASEGQPSQYYVIVQGDDVDASYDMDAYREQWMDITEGSTRHITTYAQMKAMLLAVCSDLYQPNAVLGLSTLLFPEIETEDMIYVEADGENATVDFRLAVFAVRHSFTASRPGSAMQMRGKPAGGFRRHFNNETRSSGNPPGIRDRGDIAAGMTSRWRLAPLEAQSDRLTKDEIKNRGFDTASFGGNNPPDGWTVEAGAWLTDFEFSVDATKVIKGDRCLKIKTTGLP